jgi:hypothetical protein
LSAPKKRPLTTWFRRFARSSSPTGSACASTERFSAPQLATATDRLLAYGRVSKRRGPHTAHVAPSAEQRIAWRENRPVQMP